ncbi:MAG: SDR family NAD(P)-dependent oxidoreductase [Streptosporangiales bacterium]|nr:SDR family NAD(P)-dependent oxidoreductase [Streptosporangiales bacterium]
MDGEFELKGRRVLVTGASSGIGRDLAKALAAQGMRVAVVARRADRLEQLADEVERESAERPLVLVADLSERGGAAGIAADVREAWGGVDVLVNNAGSSVGGTTWAVGDGEVARRAFEVDFWAPLALIGAFVPDLRRRGEGAVVNVTSLRQAFSWPMFGHSSAAKAALAISTETLRLELMSYGVHVVEVVPGPIDTPSQGPTALIRGFTEAVHDRLGVASSGQLAEMIVDAIRHRTDRVFCPEETTRAVYESPVAWRARIADDVRRTYAVDAALPDDIVDGLVVGADDPMVTAARDGWEREHRSAT